MSEPAIRPGTDAPGYRAIRWNMDWITRPLFGIALAGDRHSGACSRGRNISRCLAVAITVPAAYEWHRMVARDRPVASKRR